MLLFQTRVMLLFIDACADDMSIGFESCSNLEANLAIRSAESLLAIFAWPGIHWMWMCLAMLLQLDKSFHVSTSVVSRATWAPL